MQIFIIHNQTIVIDCEPNNKISWIKMKVEMKTGIPFHMQKLIRSGKILDDCMTLESYGIHNTDCLHLSTKTRGD